MLLARYILLPESNEHSTSFLSLTAFTISTKIRRLLFRRSSQWFAVSLDFLFLGEHPIALLYKTNKPKSIYQDFGLFVLYNTARMGCLQNKNTQIEQYVSIYLKISDMAVILGISATQLRWGYCRQEHGGIKAIPPWQGGFTCETAAPGDAAGLCGQSAGT